jgi:hypothetical protein
MEPEGSSLHSQVPGSEAFCAKISLQDTSLRWGVVSTSPNPQAGGPPLVCCPRLLIQYTRGWPPHWSPFLHPQPEDAPCRDGSHGKSQTNHGSWFSYKVETCRCVPSPRPYLTSRQMTCVNNQYLSVPQLAMYTARGNDITMTRQATANVTKY